MLQILHMTTPSPQDLLLQAVQLLQNQQSNSSATCTTIASDSTRRQSVLEERRRLFQPYSTQNRRRQAGSRSESVSLSRTESVPRTESGLFITLHILWMYKLW